MRFHISSAISHFLLISLLVLNTASLCRAEVITLTADTFFDKVKEKDTAWFVKFRVPWCKHCKNLGSLWEDLGKAMEGEDEIEVGEVDCGSHKSVCSKVDIHSYPTFKLFYEGEEVAKYNEFPAVKKNFGLGWTLIYQLYNLTQDQKTLNLSKALLSRKLKKQQKKHRTVIKNCEEKDKEL